MPRTILWSLIIGMLAALPVIARNALLKPPDNCVKLKIGNRTYVKGEVYLASHDDTLALKKFGFRQLEFVGRAYSTVKYAAVWPINVPLDSLPPSVSGLDYEEIDNVAEQSPEPVLIHPTPEMRAALERMAAQENSANLLLPYRQVVIGDSASGKLIEYYYKSVDTRDTLEFDKAEFESKLKGTFHVTPIEKGPFHKKETLYEKDDPTTGLIHVTPIERGPFHRKETVIIPDDPELGTFHVLPVETDYYHKVENVTTKNNPAVGTFFTRPDPGASSLRPSDFGILKNYSTFQTGQTFFTTPTAGNQPHFISWEQWRRENVRRR